MMARAPGRRTSGDRNDAIARLAIGEAYLERAGLGDDADAVLSRAGAAVAEGRIEAALTELSALPEAARDAMSDWIAGAQARVGAEAAVTRLQTQP